MEQECDFYFSVDSDAHLDNPYTLKLLLEQNRSVEDHILLMVGETDPIISP